MATIQPQCGKRYITKRRAITTSMIQDPSGFYKASIAGIEYEWNYRGECISDPGLNLAETIELLYPPENSSPVKHDPVNSPSHYTQGGIECIDAMEACLSREEFIGFLRGNSFKYRWRFKGKNGIEDLKKAEWYEQRLLKTLEKQ